MCETKKPAGSIPKPESEDERDAMVVRFPQSAPALPKLAQTSLRLLTDIANALDVPVSSLLETSQAMIDANSGGASDRAVLVAAFDEIHDPAVRQQILRFVRSCAEQARAATGSDPIKE